MADSAPPEGQGLALSKGTTGSNQAVGGGPITSGAMDLDQEGSVGSSPGCASEPLMEILFLTQILGEAPDPLNQNFWDGTQKSTFAKTLQVILILPPG